MTNGSVCNGSVFIDIDVAKAHLDVAVRPDGDTWQAANDASGIAALVARLDQRRPAAISGQSLLP